MIKGIFNWRKKEYSDDQVLNILRTYGHLERQKVIDFLYIKRFEKFLKFPKFRILLPNEEERQDVYTVMFPNFVTKLSQEKSINIKSLDAYFSKFFSDACKQEIRSKEAMKRKIEKNIDNVDISTFHFFLKSTEDLLNNIIQKNKYERVQKYLKKLNPPCATIINMMAEGYSAKEVGSRIGYKEGNVRARKKICLTKLLELLNINKELENE